MLLLGLSLHGLDIKIRCFFDFLRSQCSIASCPQVSAHDQWLARPTNICFSRSTTGLKTTQVEMLDFDSLLSEKMVIHARTLSVKLLSLVRLSPSTCARTSVCRLGYNDPRTDGMWRPNDFGWITMKTATAHLHIIHSPHVDDMLPFIVLNEI